MNKKNIEKINYSPPKKKKLFIYKNQKDNLKFKKKFEKEKNSYNASSMSKNAFINSLSKRDLNKKMSENINEVKIEKKKFEISGNNKFDNYE